MNQRLVATSSIVVAVVVVLGIASAGVKLAGQTSKPSTPTAQNSWTAPRGPDGHPDISGVWAHNAATPMERPAELADRAELTDEELVALEHKAAELFDGQGDAAFGDAIYIAALRNILGKEKGFRSRDVATGDYNSFWIVDRWFEKRTSLITDPPNGRFPPLTAEGKKRRAAAAEHRKQHPFDGPEDIALGERCITGSVPMLGGGLVAGYNNYYQIVQTPSSVAVNMEMRHDTRVIAVTSRAHLPPNVHLWLGDPVGRWQGDTFVVDSTNFRDDSPVGFGGATSKMHVTERFSRAGPESLKYEATVDDPATWTKPWTVVLNLRHSKDQIYEYACHEGNEAMSGTLRGERVKERVATEKAGKAATTKPGSR
jgi:hypothetical protein